MESLRKLLSSNNPVLLMCIHTGRRSVQYYRRHAADWEDLHGIIGSNTKLYNPTYSISIPCLKCLGAEVFQILELCGFWNTCIDSRAEHNECENLKCAIFQNFFFEMLSLALLNPQHFQEASYFRTSQIADFQIRDA
jgi:hypothetical protein